VMPFHPGPYTNLGEVYRQAGRAHESVEMFKAVVRVTPTATAFNNLGTAISRVNHYDELPEVYFRKAVELGRGHPREAYFHNNLMHTLEDRFEMGKMAMAGEAGLQRLPGEPSLVTGLCRARIELVDWQYRKADLRSFRATLNAESYVPEHRAGTAANLAQIVRFPPIVVRRFSERMAAQVLERAGGEAAVAAAAAKWQHYRERRAVRQSGTHRLRVALLSSDWEESHPVGLCMRPILHHLNPTRFTALPYNTKALDPDSGAPSVAELEAMPLRSIDHLSAQEAAKALRQASVHVMMHFNGYTKWERSDVFALHPAPVQISAIGYELTLALPAVPYLLTDLRSLPPSLAPAYSEHSVALPHAYLPTDHHARGLFTLRDGSDKTITHGKALLAAYNHNGKLDPRTFQVWCQVLQRGAAILRMRPVQFHTSGAQGAIVRELRGRGVHPESVTYLGRVDPLEQYLARMAEADLALDTIAYGGQTTTLDTLAVGVPLMTLPGDAVVARFTYAAAQVGILQRSNLADIGIVLSSKEYEDVASKFVTNS